MGKSKFDRDEAEKKYYNYLNTRIPRRIVELKKDGDSSDALLLENHLQHLREYGYKAGWEYHLRVDHEDDADKLEQFIDKYKDTYIFAYGYHEVSTKEKKPHYHIHLVFNKEINPNTIRVSYQRFWDRKGTQMSFSIDEGVSRIYTVKDHNRKFQYNISDDALKIYELISERKLEPEERKKIKKDSGKQPMELFEEAFRKECQDRCDAYNYEHVNKRDVSYYYTDDFIADFTMNWYANHLHKSFMLQKMSECAMYLRYRLHHSLDNPDPVTKRKLLEKMFG